MRHNLYKLQEERNISPKTFAELVSSTLYEKRWVRQADAGPCLEQLQGAS